MNSKASLMAALVGIAMLATPIAAAAKDHRDDYVRAQSRFVGPAIVTKHDLRNAPRATWMPAPVGVHPVREWHDRGYRGYGYRGYGAAPVYTAPAPVYAAPAYATPVYGGYGPAYVDPCRHARGVMYNYYRDRNTGHPAAAYDLLRNNQWAFHSGCSASTPYAGGGLFNRFGGLGGGPAYGYGYNGYNQPYGGYGRPYGGGSILTPFLGQFVR